jgi:hypothetical protein
MFAGESLKQSVYESLFSEYFREAQKGILLL